jgi:hypothetical protein
MSLLHPHPVSYGHFTITFGDGLTATLHYKNGAHLATVTILREELADLEMAVSEANLTSAIHRALLEMPE